MAGEVETRKQEISQAEQQLQQQRQALQEAVKQAQGLETGIQLTKAQLFRQGLSQQLAVKQLQVERQMQKAAAIQDVQAQQQQFETETVPQVQKAIDTAKAEVVDYERRYAEYQRQLAQAEAERKDIEEGAKAYRKGIGTPVGAGGTLTTYEAIKAPAIVFATKGTFEDVLSKSAQYLYQGPEGGGYKIEGGKLVSGGNLYPTTGFTYIKNPQYDVTLAQKLAGRELTYLTTDKIETPQFKPIEPIAPVEKKEFRGIFAPIQYAAHQTAELIKGGVPQSWIQPIPISAQYTNAAGQTVTQWKGEIPTPLSMIADIQRAKQIEAPNTFTPFYFGKKLIEGVSQPVKDIGTFMKETKTPQQWVAERLPASVISPIPISSQYVTKEGKPVTQWSGGIPTPLSMIADIERARLKEAPQISAPTYFISKLGEPFAPTVVRGAEAVVGFMAATKTPQQWIGERLPTSVISPIPVSAQYTTKEGKVVTQFKTSIPTPFSMIADIERARMKEAPQKTSMQYFGAKLLEAPPMLGTIEKGYQQAKAGTLEGFNVPESRLEFYSTALGKGFYEPYRAITELTLFKGTPSEKAFGVPIPFYKEGYRYQPQSEFVGRAAQIAAPSAFLLGLGLAAPTLTTAILTEPYVERIGTKEFGEYVRKHPIETAITGTMVGLTVAAPLIKYARQPIKKWIIKPKTSSEYIGLQQRIGIGETEPRTISDYFLIQKSTKGVYSVQPRYETWLGKTPRESQLFVYKPQIKAVKPLVAVLESQPYPAVSVRGVKPRAGVTSTVELLGYQPLTEQQFRILEKTPAGRRLLAKFEQRFGSFGNYEEGALGLGEMQLTKFEKVRQLKGGEFLRKPATAPGKTTFTDVFLTEVKSLPETEQFAIYGTKSIFKSTTYMAKSPKYKPLIGTEFVLKEPIIINPNPTPYELSKAVVAPDISQSVRTYLESEAAKDFINQLGKAGFSKAAATKLVETSATQAIANLPIKQASSIGKITKEISKITNQLPSAPRMVGGEGLTVSRYYGIPGRVLEETPVIIPKSVPPFSVSLPKVASPSDIIYGPLAGLKITTINIPAEKALVSTSTMLVPKEVQMGVVIQKELTKEIVQETPKVVTDQAQQPVQRVIQAPSLATGLIQVPKMTFTQKTITGTVTTPSPVTPISPPPRIPVVKLPIFTLGEEVTEPKARKKRKLPVGYTVEVRKKRKFIPVSPYAYPEQEALAIGARKVLSGSAATFRIKPSKRPVVTTGIKIPSGFANVFRTPSRPAERTYVQRQQLRIKSPGEVKEISLVGVAARASRRALSLLSPKTSRIKSRQIKIK